ncbi:hypothetical protein FRUB_02839 [Fimbriiglobus ruber]|uniref:Uncharacterized protein n=1 Tax=Fimbriiglobus ruber TaxID=1908690 RepID=A0A225DP43_9BACT|nr:hypothetical protein FRUB_02839 [Fimbriiglobus ruber]
MNAIETCGLITAAWFGTTVSLILIRTVWMAVSSNRNVGV